MQILCCTFFLPEKNSPLFVPVTLCIFEGVRKFILSQTFRAYFIFGHFRRLLDQTRKRKVWEESAWEKIKKFCRNGGKNGNGGMGKCVKIVCVPY
jgi:hypothetical protein